MSLKGIFTTLLQSFPEMFLVTFSGIKIPFNGATWYISAMLLCMLPLAYMLYKCRDFTLYVFSPLTALFTLGYICQVNNFIIIDHNDLFGVVLGGIVRAVSGLCFGIVAWLIYDRLVRLKANKNLRIILTVTEILLYFFFFSAWLWIGDNKATASTLLTLPISLAITFSGKSYLSVLFKFKWMRHLNGISLAIYLNHWGARYAIYKLFPDFSYKKSVALLAAYTVVSCMIYYSMIVIAKSLWNNKLKKLFTKKDVPDV